MYGILKVEDGPDKGKTFTLAEGQTVEMGRDPKCQFRLVDSYVASVHCRLVLRDGKVTLTDVGSGAGTEINGQAVQEQQLSANDQVRIGKTTLIFRESQLDEHSTQAIPILPPDL